MSKSRIIWQSFLNFIVLKYFPHSIWMGCTAIGNMALNVFGLVFEGKKTQLQPETKQDAEWLEFFKEKLNYYGTLYPQTVLI